MKRSQNKFKKNIKVVMILGNPFTNDPRVYKEAKTLAQNGYKVVVYAVNPTGKLKIHESIDGFEVKRLNIDRYIFRLNPVKSIKQFFPALFLLRNEKADVYHAHDLDTITIAYFSTLGEKAKFIYDSHEYWSDRRDIDTDSSLFRRMLRGAKLLQEKFLIKKTSMVMTVSDSIAQAISTRYQIKLPIVLKNCPEKSKIPIGNKFSELKSAGSKVVLYQGNFTRVRGLIELVRSVKWWKPNVILVLLGDGELKEELEKIVEQLHLKDKVLLLPSVPMREVSKYSASADLGVVTFLNVSLNHYYALPNKIFEYMHAGLPVVASDFPEMKKIVVENDFGVVCNPSGPKEIADAINSILSDENRLRKMRENATRATKKYNWEIESKKLLKAYDEATRK